MRNYKCHHVISRYFGICYHLLYIIPKELSSKGHPVAYWITPMW